MEDNSFTHLLKSTERFRRQRQALNLLFQSLKYLFLAFIILLTLDVIFHWQPIPRILALGLFGLIIALLIALWSWSAFWATRPLKSIARDVEDNDPQLSSELINSLDLNKQLDNDELQGMSADLAKVALEQYADKMDLERFQSAVNPGDLKRHFKNAFWALSLMLIFLIPFKNVVSLQLLRYFDPFGDHPPFSLTSLEITEPAADGFKVVYGEKLQVRAEFQGHRPDELYITIYDPQNPEKVMTLPLFDQGEKSFAQGVENVKTELEFFVHSADHKSRSRKRRTGIILTPDVIAASVTVQPPRYTELPVKKRPYKWSNLTALKGSQVSFELSSNRPLQSGVVELIYPEKTEKVDMRKSAECSVEGTFTITENVRLRFTVTDIDGYQSTELLKGSILAGSDRAPAVEIVSPQTDSFVTEDFVLKVKVQASDDYGVAEIRLHRALNNFFGQPLVYQPEVKISTNAVQIVEIPITDLGVDVGDTLSLYADTTDNSPEGQMAMTRTVHLKVVSVQAYNDYLRERVAVDDIQNKYSQIMDRMSELAEEQKQINQAIDDLAKEMAKNTNDDKSAEMNALIRRQNEINKKLDSLAEEMQNFGRENPLYDIEEEFSEIMKQQAEELRESTRRNNESLKKFSQQMSSKSKGPDAVEALKLLHKSGKDQEETIAAKEKEYDERVLQTLTDMSLMNDLVADFNHFKVLYQMQEELSSKLWRFDVLRELSRSDALQLKRSAGDEKYIEKELGYLVEDLREHAEFAEIQFPKASASALKLAEGIEEKRLVPMATKAINAMLLPDGPDSYQLAERLRVEMRKFFEDPEKNLGGQKPFENNPYMQDEFDRYLKLLGEMDARETFEQMCRSRSIGRARGRGRGYGRGNGVGSSGRSTQGRRRGGEMGLLGNEQFSGEAQSGKGSGRADSGNSTDDTDVTRLASSESTTENAGGNSKRGRKASAVESDKLINDYENLIEAYFEKLTGGDQ